MIEVCFWQIMLISQTSILDQMYQPKEVEEVKVVPKTEEDTMKEYLMAGSKTARKC